MTSRDFVERVGRRARRAGFTSVAPELLASFETYYRLLEAWNAKINLTALDLPAMGDEAIDRLLIEPLVAVRHIPADARCVIDIGSGGGSPAIPMQLARTDLAFTLVEAKTRKSAFRARPAASSPSPSSSKPAATRRSSPAPTSTKPSTSSPCGPCASNPKC